MRGITAHKDDFWRKMITLAAPIALQNLVATLLNLVDTLMVGQLGDAAIAAVGLANQLFFLLMLFLFGISSGSAIFMAQYWGKRDLRSIHRVQGLCLALSTLLSLVFGLVGLTAPRWVLSLFSNDPEVVVLGAEYLRIAAIGYLPTAVTQVYASALRSTEQVRAPMAVSIVALGANTTLNYLLILGHMGFPRMGVSGAALATIIARGVECALLLLIVYGKQMTAAAPIRDMLNQRREFYPRFFKTTTPVILNEGLWALGVPSTTRSTPISVPRPSPPSRSWGPWNGWGWWWCLGQGTPAPSSWATGSARGSRTGPLRTPGGSSGWRWCSGFWED